MDRIVHGHPYICGKTVLLMKNTILPRKYGNKSAIAFNPQGMDSALYHINNTMSESMFPKF